MTTVAVKSHFLANNHNWRCLCVSCDEILLYEIDNYWCSCKLFRVKSDLWHSLWYESLWVCVHGF